MPKLLTIVMAEIAIRQQRSYAHHTFLQSSNANKEKIDLSNLPNHVKSMIMEQATVRLKHYEPGKVSIRSEQKLTTLDAKQLLIQRKKRMQGVYNCGFCSDPKEYYRPLGDPVVNTEQLLYDTLKLDVKALK